MEWVLLNQALQSCYNCVLFVTKNSWFSSYFGLCGGESSHTALSLPFTSHLTFFKYALEQQHLLLRAIFSIWYCSDFRSLLYSSLDGASLRIYLLALKTKTKSEEKMQLEEGLLGLWNINEEILRCNNLYFSLRFLSDGGFTEQQKNRAETSERLSGLLSCSTQTQLYWQNSWLAFV